ncbi:MAG TPA: hypothetical protein VM942_05725 [Acidimicrobiales bacterium]|nr:hypothetical protein [Acidimicrobiales bacterium]
MGSVSLRLATGEAVLGTVTVAVALVGERGELRVGGESGPVVRPLRFGERWHAVRHALTAPDPVFELTGAVRTLASGRAAATAFDDGGDDAGAVDVLALHLAGAGSGAPGFATVAAVLARTLGWGPDTLAASDATEADYLAGLVADAAPDDGWQRLVFDPAGGDDPARSLARLRSDLAADLLRRGQEPPDLSLVDLGQGGATPFEHGFPPEVASDVGSLGDHRLEGPEPTDVGAATGGTVAWPDPSPRLETASATAGWPARDDPDVPDRQAGGDRPVMGQVDELTAGGGPAAGGPGIGGSGFGPRGVGDAPGGLGRRTGGGGGLRGAAARSPARSPGPAASEGIVAGATGAPGWWDDAAVRAGWAPSGRGRGPRTAARRSDGSNGVPDAASAVWASPAGQVLAIEDGPGTGFQIPPDGAGGEAPARPLDPEQLADAVAAELHRTADLRGIDG